MNNEYTYIGAFLKLSNIWTTRSVEVDACPNHGEWGAKTKSPFCPECGSKIVKITKEENVRKHICGDWDGKKEEWLDKMFIAHTDTDPNEDFMILLPNHKNSGQIQGVFDDDGPICLIDEKANSKCQLALHDKYSDYIEWLVNVRKFDVVMHFGIVKYWN